MRFSFIHAADLHIDSPLAALGRRNAEAAARFADAGRKAVTALIHETLTSKAAFLIIAGDIFDGDWADYSTGLFFIRELARLERAGIPVFMVRGNHDAENRMSKALNWPDNVVEFPSRKAASHALDDLHVMLHGRSFGDRDVPDDFVQSYPAAHDGWLNIGVLHTALDGVRGHASYAPCTRDELRRFGYDYWALGHIHKPEIVARDPWIVFPGNIQGRSVRETGARGAMRVAVDDGVITGVEPIALDSARWAEVEIDAGGMETEASLLDLVHEQLDALHANADGRALAVRLHFTGETALHNQLIAGHQQLEAEAQGIAARIAYDCWVEKIMLATRAPARRNTTDPALEGIDAGKLLHEAAKDEAFTTAINALVQDIRGKLAAPLQSEFDDMVTAAGGLASLDAEVKALIAGSLSQAEADAAPTSTPSKQAGTDMAQ